jgi:hypothetical protein
MNALLADPDLAVIDRIANRYERYPARPAPSGSRLGSIMGRERRRRLAPPPATSAMVNPAAYADVPRNRTIIGVDISGFGRRDVHVQNYVRKAMYEVLRQGFADTGIRWPDPMWWEDRGDGVLLTLSSEVPTLWVFDPLVPHIGAGLRRHNKVSSDAAQLRLRMAVTAGYVHRDEHGLAGEALVRLARLLDAPAFRAAVIAERAALGLIVSRFIYENVIRPGLGLVNPDSYRRLLVENKETTTEAWLHFPIQTELAHRL